MKTINKIAAEMGIHPTNVRKYIEKNRIPTDWIRSAETNNNKALALSEESEAILRQLREKEGYCSEKVLESSEFGHFYMYQAEPEKMPERIKAGFTNDLRRRRDDFKTVNPNVVLVKSWSCKKAWESAALRALEKSGHITTQHGPEVFDTCNLQFLISTLDGFFGYLNP